MRKIPEDQMQVQMGRCFQMSVQWSRIGRGWSYYMEESRLDMGFRLMRKV